MPELSVKHVPAMPPAAALRPSTTRPSANRRQLTLMIASAIATVCLVVMGMAASAARLHHYSGKVSLFEPNPTAVFDIPLNCGVFLAPAQETLRLRAKIWLRQFPDT